MYLILHIFLIKLLNFQFYRFLSEGFCIPGLPQAQRDEGFVEVAPDSCSLEKVATN